MFIYDEFFVQRLFAPPSYRGGSRKTYRVKRSRYAGADLRQIRRAGQARECARRRRQLTARATKAA